MAKGLFRLIVVLALAGLATAGPLQDQFGITLSVGAGTVAGHAVTDTFTNSWTPVSATANYVVNDWYGKPALQWNPYPHHTPPQWGVGTFPNGGEPYDYRYSRIRYMKRLVTDP